jgi:hypothetical protein
VRIPSSRRAIATMATLLIVPTPTQDDKHCQASQHQPADTGAGTVDGATTLRCDVCEREGRRQEQSTTASHERGRESGDRTHGRNIPNEWARCRPSGRAGDPYEVRLRVMVHIHGPPGSQRADRGDKQELEVIATFASEVKQSRTNRCSVSRGLEARVAA